MQVIGRMKGFSALLAGCLLLHLSAAQSTFPDSDLYNPLKFDLGIGNSSLISTVEGNTTNLISETLENAQLAARIAANEGFVQTRGSQFVINGNPWYCAGTNAYYAALKYIMSDNEVSVMMRVS
jgi:hypothetical protein